MGCCIHGMGVMMIYAEARHGVIHQVWKNIPDDEKFTPPLLSGSILMSFPDGMDVRPGMLWDGSQLLPPPPPSLAEIKRQAAVAVRQYADEIGNRLTADYPRSEVLSWPRKADVAERWLADTSRPVPPIIAEEAQLTAQAPEDLARTIIQRAEVFERVAGVIAGLRRKVLAAIDAATTPEEVETALQQGRQEAEQIMQQIGVG